jgi:hypothetical protein
MRRILSYLAELTPNPSGQAICSVSNLMTGLNLNREEIFTHVMQARDEGLVLIATTLDTGPNGLLSVTLIKRGRLYLKGEDYSHLPNPHETKLPYNLLLDQRP